MLSVAAAGCSFPGNGGGTSDGPIGDPVDAPFGTPDARRSDARLDAARPIDARPDATPPPPDAGFSPALCPGAYNIELPAVAGSRYRYISSALPFAAHHADCNNDLTGWTHLVALDTIAEAQAMGDINPTNYSYVGAAQAPGESQTDTGWRLFTGGDVTTGWSPMSTQPDDDEGIEDGEESLAIVAGTGNMHDVAGLSSYQAICECDGLPIDPVVATYIP